MQRVTPVRKKQSDINKS